MKMNYKLEIKKNGHLNLFSPKIRMYVMEDVMFDELKIALVTEMEYKVKLDIVKLLMTFPHGFETMDDQVIVRQDAVDEYEVWYEKVHQQIGFLDEYYSLIDEKIAEVLS